MTDHDDNDILGLIHATERAFDASEARPPASETSARRVFETLRHGALRSADSAGDGRQLPVCSHLDVAIESARARGGPVADVALAMEAVGTRARWERRRGAENQTAEFAAGHANALLVQVKGPGRTVVLGVSLMAPNVRYPDHHHPPEEIYIVLSPGQWRQSAGVWHEPGPGSVVHNPPGIMHAMRSGDAPLLALWLHLDES